jgi:hypothetical protein
MEIKKKTQKIKSKKSLKNRERGKKAPLAAAAAKRVELFCGFEFGLAMESILGGMLGRSLQPFGRALLSTFHRCLLQV